VGGTFFMAIEPIGLLKQVFPGMSVDALVELAWLTTTHTYPPDTLLCHEGVEEDVFYIIGEGQVMVTQRFGDEERLLRYAGPGQYFGEMALIADTPRNANVRTVVETTVLEIDKDIFAEMIRRNPIIALTMFRTTVGWLRANDAAAIAELSSQKQEIERAYHELRMQEKRRTEFLSTLSHELRTPLTTASGYMQLIKSGNMAGPALHMALDKVSSGLDRVVSLVNDLLFVQEMDLLEPTIRPVNLPEIVAVVVEEAEDHAQENGITLVTSFPPVLPEIQADVDGLTRAFRALLDNAIKFSPDGGEVRIEIGVTSDHANVAFMDPGIGIEPEFVPRIFERFVRREQYGNTLFGGMGLGLSIAKHLVESIGGHISVQSEVGQGSIFTVHLPVLISAEPDEPAASQ
jgi:signal transduction histidine kinase